MATEKHNRIEQGEEKSCTNVCTVAAPDPALTLRRRPGEEITMKNIMSVSGKAIATGSLAELCDWLNEQTQADIDNYIDMCNLPVFSDETVINTEDIWSWDENSLLIFDEGASHKYILIPRQKFIKYRLLGCSDDTCDQCDSLPAEWMSVTNKEFYCDNCLPPYAEKITDEKTALRVLQKN